MINTDLKHEKFANKLNKVEMCGVTRLAADHPPLMKRRIEPRRRKSLLPCEKKSGTKAIHHVRYVYLGDRCMSVLVATVKKNQWTADFELWIPYRLCKLEILGMRYRSVMLR